MTTPAPETLEREKDKLFVTDAELYRRLGMPYAIAKPVIDELTEKMGFPPKQKIWGGRRYWRAVLKWLDENNDVLNPEEETPSRVLRGSFGRGGQRP